MSNYESTTIRVPLHMREFYIDVYVTQGKWELVEQYQSGNEWVLTFRRSSPTWPS